MNEILISIKPKYCELIALGRKTIEIRKTRPKMPTPFKAVIYCTNEPVKANSQITPGRVIGEFICSSILVIPNTFGGYSIPYEDLMKSALKHSDLDKYGKGRDMYGWRISDFTLYDKPKQLSELCKITKLKNCFEIERIERAPQSWCYLTREG